MDDLIGANSIHIHWL